jgi:hypothetical protein
MMKRRAQVGALEAVSELAADWLARWLGGKPETESS